jgi:murein DD-endopeptidase MepM/ murein hydrolase activator NlpD
MPPRKRRLVTIQILPEGAGEAWTFRLSRPFFEFLFYALIIALFAAAFASVKIMQIQGKVFLANHLAVRNQELLAQQQKMVEIEEQMVQIREKEEAIRNIMEAFLTKEPDLAAPPVLQWSSNDINAYFDNLSAINRRLESRDKTLAQERQPNIWPVKGIVSQRFSTGGAEDRHDGIDILAEENAVVVSAARGMVIEEGWDNDLGRYVRINHDFDAETVYGHLASTFVKAGDQLAKGDALGIVGNTGRSLGPHLHFEIILKGKAVDPLSYLE